MHNFITGIDGKDCSYDILAIQFIELSPIGQIFNSSDKLREDILDM